MLPITFAPSLPAASWGELENLLKSLHEIVSEFQVDIVDGRFVPHISWPFCETDPVSALSSLKPWSTRYHLEVDCMVMNPEQYLDTLADLGVKRVVIHIGSTEDHAGIIAHASVHGYKIGIAATADVPFSELLELVPLYNYVQLMGIAAVGSQGQPFDTRILKYARDLRDRFPDLEIAVDGSVNKVTIPQLFAAGVNRFAPGSAIAKAEDPARAFHDLVALVKR